ncbi:MAG: hypothetical protein RBS24_06080 [Bacilli bacterium]|nr:hypothetical protein [Bacilli bacterium]
MTLVKVWINENKTLMVDIKKNSFQLSQIYLEDGADGMISTYDLPDYEVERIMKIVNENVKEQF